MKKTFWIVLLILLAAGWLYTRSINPAFSASSRIQELQDKINQKNQEIDEIQKEIDRCETEINKAVKSAGSLKNQISQLEKTAAKLKAQIQLTEQNINSANLVLEKLAFQIEEKNIEIGNKKEQLATIIRQIDEEESIPLVEILLAHSSISEFFDNIENMQYLQKNVNFSLEEIRALKNELGNQQNKKEAEKTNFESLQNKMSDQKKIAEINKSQKNNLLQETKNKETVYRNLLSAQIEKQKALEKEIANYEAQLKIEIDPSSLPAVGSGVLAWPVDNPVITQYFGNTDFATKNPQVYHGGGHNGIDFRASLGTPVKAARSGIVIGIGDTDSQCTGVSYGKWVLIKHDNNLSTLYAHFSLIKVSSGQNVAKGEIIGYSGSTGYVTGPHLHFAVFASQAVSIGTIKSKICGTNMTLPVAPYNGYLNPLSYL